MFPVMVQIPVICARRLYGRQAELRLSCRRRASNALVAALRCCGSPVERSLVRFTREPGRAIGFQAGPAGLEHASPLTVCRFLARLLILRYLDTCSLAAAAAGTAGPGSAPTAGLGRACPRIFLAQI
jgi:hypothetical protein